MFVRVGIPLIVVLLVAMLLFALVLYRMSRERELARRERLLSEESWDGVCEFENPETGAKCQRAEFHLENHYRDVNGYLVQW